MELYFCCKYNFSSSNRRTRGVAKAGGWNVDLTKKVLDCSHESTKHKMSDTATYPFMTACMATFRSKGTFNVFVCLSAAATAAVSS